MNFFAGSQCFRGAFVTNSVKNQNNKTQFRTRNNKEVIQYFSEHTYNDLKSEISLKVLDSDSQEKRLSIEVLAIMARSRELQSNIPQQQKPWK